MTDNLTGKTIRAAKWTYLSTLVTASLQILVTAVLARLLAPESFGLVAMAGLVLRFGQYFAQMGVGQAIVQRAELSEDHAAAGFWASLVIGGLFTVIAWLAAPLAATAFESAELTSVLRWMSLALLISGTSTTSYGLLRRALRFKAIAVIEIVAYVIGYGGALTLAFNGAGVWALVFAGLTQAFVASSAFNALARPRLVPVLRWRPYRELLGFGSTVSVVSFLEFLNSSLDTMVVGRVAGASQLGLYNRALSLTNLPMYYMSTSLSRVLLPSFSRLQRDTGRLGRGYLKVVTLAAGLGIPIALGMSGSAREIVAVLLGSQWSGSVPVMRVVAVAACASMLSHFAGVTLEATAHLKDKLVLRSVQLVVFAGLLFGLGRFGLVGYASAFAISEVLLHIAIAQRISSHLQLGPRETMQAYKPGLVGGVVLWLLTRGTSMAAAQFNWPVLVMLLLQIAIGVALFVLFVLRLDGNRVWLILDGILSHGNTRFSLAVARVGGMVYGRPRAENPSD